jgi:hypothetical protein
MMFRTCDKCSRLMLSDARGNFADCICENESAEKPL